MFKENRKYLYVFLGAFVLILAVQYLLPKPINWNRTYMAKDKAPFGAYAIRQLINGVYSDSTRVNNQTLYNLSEKIPSNSSVLMINDRIDLNKSDMNSFYQMLDQGHTFFIAANEFSGALADSLHLRTRYTSFNFFSNLDSMLIKPGERIRLLSAQKKFNYPQAVWASGFTHFDTLRFEVLATLGKNEACLLRGKVRNGNVYLMSVPDVFGNYFIARHPNRELVYRMLSMVRNKNLVWDEYYKTYNVSNYSPIKFILESDALYSAYLLMLFAIIFYMFTEGRRRQRAIPVLEPVKNTTLEFVNVVSHVYFNSKSHGYIAAENIKYFYESIRKRFNTSTSVVNEDLVKEVITLSGVNEKQTRQLFSYCERLRTATEVTELDVVELDRQINNFNKNSLR